MTRRAIPQDIYGDTSNVALVRGEIAWDAVRGILRMGDGATVGGQEFYPSSVQHVTARATMAGLPVRASRVVSVAADESLWEWRTGNHAAAVASDPLHGLYQPHVSIAVSTGCWVRRWDGLHGRPEWFGAQTGNAAFDCHPALQACVALCPATLLQRADYWISQTWKVQTPWRSIVGQGNVSYEPGQGTRILITSGTATVMQVGADTDPGGNPGTQYLRGVTVESLSLGRALANVPNIDINANPKGLRAAYLYRCWFRNVASWESNIGFQMHGVVYGLFDDCYAFRSPSGGADDANIFYGFHLIGSPAVLAGGNASIYLNRCAANLAGGQNFFQSAGFRLAGAFVDSFLDWPETVGSNAGIWVSGTGDSPATNSNIDLHIHRPIIDQPFEFAILFETLNRGSAVELTSMYTGMPGTATAGLAIVDSAGLVTVRGGQAIAGPGAGQPIGLYVKNSSGVDVDGYKVSDCQRPVALDEAKNCSIRPRVNGTTVAGVQAAVVAIECSRVMIEPKIIGGAAVFPAGVELVGNDNDHIEVRCTLIDPACITGGATNKLVADGDPVTATGTFATNCLASGIMS